MLVDRKRVNDFEIVIGFVAPIGTDLDLVASTLRNELRVYSYASETIRLSHLLDVDGKATDSAGYYTARMDSGDALRSKYGSGDALAAIASARMIALRGDSPRERRFAWLLRTLKHEDEVELLRQTYGKRFVLVGVHQDESRRMRNLASRLRDESPGSSDMSSEAAVLMRRDESDTENEFGQHGRDTYASADYFIDLEMGVQEEVSRFAGLLFADPFITPTKDEIAMFHAFGASLRSADSGRQVGAVICAESGEVLATGANEVPKGGGGEYWVGDIDDARDFQMGHDFNKKQSMRALGELLGSLSAGGLLSEDMTDATGDERLKMALTSTTAKIKRTRIMSLIEFGRVVHAEMSALTQAARLGTAVKGATLYTTAFPCHMCMRLIISSGIARVIYVDPYPKSLASEMYADSITTERRGRDEKVLITPYIGASWTIYPAVFRQETREKSAFGIFPEFKKSTARMTLPGPEPLLNAVALEAQIAIALSPAGAKKIRTVSRNKMRNNGGIKWPSMNKTRRG